MLLLYPSSLHTVYYVISSYTFMACLVPRMIRYLSSSNLLRVSVTQFRAFSKPPPPQRVLKGPSAMEEHEKQVAAISAKVRSFREQDVKFRISHGSTNSTRSSATRRDHNVIDISALSHVIKVDKASRIAWVEPNVPMDRLVEETMKYGLIPPVVMEFPGITVGGGYAGTSGESSSFKYVFCLGSCLHPLTLDSTGTASSIAPSIGWR